MKVTMGLYVPENLDTDWKEVRTLFERRMWRGLRLAEYRRERRDTRNWHPTLQ